MGQEITSLHPEREPSGGPGALSAGAEPAAAHPTAMPPAADRHGREESEAELLRVLLVDDDVENLRLLRRLLHRRYRLLIAPGGATAVDCLKEFDVQIVLSDYRMPEVSGVDVLATAYSLRPDAVRILVTAFGDMEIAADAINRGRVDFMIRKPWSEGELRATLARAEEIYRLKSDNQDLVKHLRAKNQALIDKERQLEQTLDDRGRELLDTVRELERTNQRLSELVLRDGLTGVFNHRCFQSRLREECERAHRYRRTLGLIFIDIDHFKMYNDLHGHPSGDQLLCTFAKALCQTAPASARASDVVARYGGDEFVVLLPEATREGALMYAARLRQAVAAMHFSGEEQLPGGKLTLSCGVAIFPDDADNAAGLLAMADQALYHAKLRGRDRVEPASGAPKGPLPKSPAKVEQAAVVSYRDRFKELEAILAIDGCLSALLFNFSRLRAVEQHFGRAMYEDLRRTAEQALASWAQGASPSSLLLYSAFGNETFLLFSGSGEEGALQSHGEGQARAEALEVAIAGQLSEKLWTLTAEPLFAAIGHARIIHDPGQGFLRQIEVLMGEASKVEELRHYQQQLRAKDVIQKIILTKDIQTLYQSIVHIGTQQTVGYEALTRGPQNTQLHYPDRLFQTSERLGLHHQLDRVCIRQAIDRATGMGPVGNLFVNVLPSTLHDGALIAEDLPRRLERAGLTPAQLVLEVSEKEAMRDPIPFQSAVERCHIAGLRVAIDDLGSRYANFDALLAGTADYIKISDVLVRGIEKSAVKQGMIRGLLAIAVDMGASIITEGVETQQELDVLSQVGVQYCQGWYFSRAAPPPWAK